MSETPSRPPLPARLLAWLGRRAVFAVWAFTVVFLFLRLSPSTGWLPELARHFLLYLILGTLLAGGIALCARRWLHGFVGLLSAAAMAMPLVPYYRKQAEPAESMYGQGADFSLVSCNLLRIVKDPDTMRRVLKEWNPDVLLLQEYTPEWSAALKSVTATYPHQLGRIQDDPFGIWFGSRLPLEELRVEDVGARRFPVIIARIKANARTVRFLGAHATNPVAPSRAGLWRDQFEEYAEVLTSGIDETRIVAGDLNATPFCLTFGNFLKAANLRDSALGHGLGSTWFSPVPGCGLPIDHVLLTPSLEVLEREIGPDTGSDHRPLRLKLRVL